MPNSSPHFRTDVLTGQQVIVAPNRSQRPSSHRPDPALNCIPDPFAEGHESETPDEHFAIRSGNSAPNGPGWTLRVVPNRYPSVEAASVPRTVDNGGLTGDDELFPCRPACGDHDVVIECPDGRSRMIDLSTAEIQQTFIAWRTRMQQFLLSPNISSVAVFRNEGFSAGASLAHCHSQIVATADMMPLDLARHECAVRHRANTGRDIVQDVWNAEHRQRVRVIRESGFFGVCCPFASRASWQVRFVPKQNQPCFFAEASNAMLLELAALLKATLLSLNTILNGPFSFNLTLSHPPINQTAAFSWYLDVLPRTGRSAGFELLTNMDIITVAPELAAEKIREVIDDKSSRR